MWNPFGFFHFFCFFLFYFCMSRKTSKRKSVYKKVKFIATKKAKNKKTESRRSEDDEEKEQEKNTKINSKKEIYIIEMLHRQFSSTSIYFCLPHTHLYRWNIYTNKHMCARCCVCIFPLTTSTVSCIRVVVKKAHQIYRCSSRMCLDWVQTRAYVQRGRGVIVFQSTIKAYVCTFSTLLRVFFQLKQNVLAL